MESCCFRSGVKASAVTPQTKVEPGFIFHQFFRVLAGSCVFVFKAWRVCEKQPKAKTSGCLLPSLLKRSRHSASDQLCLSGLHSLTHRLKLVFLSMEQVFLKPCSEMTIISHLWAVCTRPPGVQLWVRINSDYRWTTDLTLINLPPDFHLKQDAGGDLTNDQKQTAVFPVGRLFRLLFVSRLSKHGWTADGRFAAKTANAHVCVVSLDVSLRENSVICFVHSPKSGTMFITRFVIWPSTMTWCSVLKCLPFTPKKAGFWGETHPQPRGVMSWRCLMFGSESGWMGWMYLGTANLDPHVLLDPGILDDYE